MPRIRSIKPDVWDDPAIGEVSRDARLLFVGLITQADDDGRSPGNPQWLIAKLYPYDNVTADEVDRWLAELGEAGLILSYTHANRPYIELPAWRDNQSIDKRYYRESKFPGAHDEGSTSARRAHDERSTQDRIGEDRRGEDRRGVVESDDAPLSHLLADFIEQNGSKRPNVSKRWADAERLLLERDGRDRSEAERLIRWCQADEFWRSNVLSMPKFREKYDQLRLQAQRNGNGEHRATRRARQILGGGDVVDGSAEEVAA